MRTSNNKDFQQLVGLGLGSLEEELVCGGGMEIIVPSRLLPKITFQTWRLDWEAACS